MLLLVGLGLDVAEITLKGVNSLKNSDEILLESYTNTITSEQIEYLEKLVGKSFERISRQDVEDDSAKLIERAKGRTIAVLISGDPVAATTHASLVEEARAKGVEVEVVSAPSIFTAVGKTGLQLYKFGRTVSFPSFGEFPSVVEYTKKNLESGLHTLILLDIGMDPKVAISKLKEFFPEFVVVSRANRPDMRIVFGEAGKLEALEYGESPHCLIVPGKMHFTEGDFLKWFRI